MATGDVDADGDIDVLVADGLGVRPNRLWINNGSGIFTDSGQSLGLGATHAVQFGDVDNDGDLDAFFVNYVSPNLLWINNGAGFFSDSGQLIESSWSDGIDLGDVDGDGDLDVFVANESSAPNTVWLNGE